MTREQSLGPEGDEEAEASQAEGRYLSSPWRVLLKPHGIVPAGFQTCLRPVTSCAFRHVSLMEQGPHTASALALGEHVLSSWFHGDTARASLV